jgi:hypothetical protein
MDIDPIWDAITSAEDDRKPAPQAKLVVTISPQIELMLITAMLAAPGLSPGHYGTLDQPVAQDARRWFSPFADHPAVVTVRRLFYVESASAFACDALTSYILRRGEPPDLVMRFPYSKSALARANGESSTLDRLADQLGDFYQVSQFASFWEQHAEGYRAIKERVAGFIKAGWAGEAVVKTMEDYFGQGKAAYILIPTPMERPGGGTMDPVGADDGYILASFDGTVSQEWVLYLLYHEVGHSYVNPLAERYKVAVQQYEGLYPQLGEAMRPWGYNNWVVALNEHILRAQNCRLRRQLQGDAAAEEQLREEQSKGFRFIRALDSKLAEYETQRDRYPSLADFYPKLLTAFDPFLRSGESG